MGSDPGTDRTWLIRKNAPHTSVPFDSFMASIVGPNTEPVSVVEGARLREAEAELAEAREALERANLERIVAETFIPQARVAAYRNRSSDVIDALAEDRARGRAGEGHRAGRKQRLSLPLQ